MGLKSDVLGNGKVQMILQLFMKQIRGTLPTNPTVTDHSKLNLVNSILSYPVSVRGSKPSSLFLMYVKLVVSSVENCTKLSRRFLLASSVTKKFSPNKRFTCHQA